VKDEIARIIAMVQEGKIDSDEAGDLISALKSEPETRTESQSGYLGRTLKIRIQSDEKENVNVNVPLRLVKGLLKMGHGIASNIPQAKQYADDIDIDLLISAIDNEITGKIIDVKSDDGNIVAVYIE
jgi:hypothetical protein